MKALLIISSFLLLNLGWSADSELRAFKTDYCTNYPEGTLQNPSQWKHCCLMHDMYYWAGGVEVDKDKADLDLRQCVEDSGAPRTAAIMYYGVRAGSLSPIKYPDMKWNNGWKERPDFQALIQEDVLFIKTELDKNYDFISPELKEKFLHQLRSRLE